MAEKNDPLDTFLPRKYGQTEEEYLAAWEEHWNQRIDRDVGALGEGLRKIVDGAQKSLTPSQPLQTAQHLSLLTHSQQLLSAAESLSTTIQQLRLLVLLSDEEGRGKVKREEEERLGREREEERRGVEEGLRKLEG